MVLSDDSRAHHVEWGRHGVADGTGDAATNEVTHVRVRVDELDVPPGAVQLIVSGELSQPVEHAQQLCWDVSLPQAVQSLVAEDREERLPGAGVAGTGDVRYAFNLQLQADLRAV